ncbi:MAG: primosomal protein N' [Alistipes sp.]|jgi:primosomal protein N' (replication factor Y)|nr:primosomal protein N' [Alistipes sp.]
MTYADLILPVAGPCYTFSVGDELAASVAPGCAVSVQFGAGGRKIVGGIVRRMHGEKPPYARVKPVLSLLFPEPLVSPAQLRLWEWMADYYMCTAGEVMRAALPAMLKPAGFSAEEFAADEFRGRTVRMVALSAALSESSEGVGVSGVSKGVEVSEVSEGAALSGETAFNEACEKLRRRAPKQYEALVEIAGACGFGAVSGEIARASLKADTTIPKVEVPRSNLKADSATLAALQKKGLVTIDERPAREDDIRFSTFNLPELSTAQQTALDGLREALRSKDTALLFGVPASGKSEVAFHAIAGTLDKGRDVLLLLPEISLTTQFVGRVKKAFGERVVLYHSGLSDRRRAEAYVRVARSGGAEAEGNRGGGTLVVGTRSAIFLPLPRLGLVVVDEEQDASYKQQDPAPRYNARDAAVVLARLSKAKVVLMSATPSLETWLNADSGKYGLVELGERYGGTLPPEVIISDTLRAAKRGERKSHFNKELLDRMRAALARGEQVVLFQNRRGMAPFAECPDCGFVPRCDHCAIPMTAHRRELRCHYCGSVAPSPAVCPTCGSVGITTRGFGTEKIEDELARLLPDARVARLDRDSAGSERTYARIIGDFEHGATDILVGTQMVTKGLDFAGVSLVGVLNADNLVNHPDFRASERAYQLLAQVAGRAGRRAERGEVVIQTASPGSRLIAQAAAGDYRAMAADMLAERVMYGYPPYSRLVSVMLRHPDRAVLGAAACRFGELLGGHFGDRLLGPEAPVTEKIKGEFALVFLLKIPRGESASEVRETVRRATAALLSDPEFRKATVTPNVDPM